MKKCNSPKNILISGYYGFDNFGDEAILGVLTSKLKELNCEITVLSKNPDKTSKIYGVNSIPTFGIAKIFKKMQKADFLFSGGGSLLQNVTSSKSLIYYLIIINLAMILRKKVVIFAQGIGPVNGTFCRFLTKNTLRRANLVTVRDKKSFELMQNWNINAKLLCDPLFSLQLAPSAPSGKIGVQIRSFKTLTDKMLKKLAMEVCNSFSDKKIEIFSFQDALDLKVCRKFEQNLKDIDQNINSEVVFNQNSSEILERIKDLDYMIGMRFHACLIALKYGIRTLAINYDEKVEKLAQEANIPYVSMSGNEDYREEFRKLKALKTEELAEFSKSKIFDWSIFNELLNS